MDSGSEAGMTKGGWNNFRETFLKVVMPQAFQAIVHCNDLNLMQAQNRLIRHAGEGRYPL
jgi:hypothetical protein